LLSRGEYYALVIAEFRAAKSTQTSGKNRKIPGIIGLFRHRTGPKSRYFVAILNIHHNMEGRYHKGCRTQFRGLRRALIGWN